MAASKKTNAIKAGTSKKPAIRIAIIENDPVRLVGFRTLLDSEPDFELISGSLTNVSALQGVDLILLGNCKGQNLFDLMASLKASCPNVRIIVTGSRGNEESILTAIASGAKGYVDETAPINDFVQAIRTVNQGSVWAPRRVLSIFIQRSAVLPGSAVSSERVTFTNREKEVLEMLVTGQSNKEIGTPLGITERTVKAHVAKLMRKVGVKNRIALSVQAINRSLTSPR